MSDAIVSLNCPILDAVSMTASCDPKERIKAVKCVRYLIERGADIYLTDEYNEGAIDPEYMRKCVEGNQLRIWREEYRAGLFDSLLAGHGHMMRPLAELIGEYVQT